MSTLVMDIEQAVDLLKCGDSKAWEDMVLQYQIPLSRYLYNMVKDKELARDLTQDTFLEAYQAMPRIKGELNLKPWLYRIATNNAIQVLRRRKLISWLPLMEEIAVTKETDTVVEDSVDQRQLVRNALNKLPGKYRSVLLLHDDQGFNCQEIAGMLNISLEAAKKRLARGRMIFRDAYERSERG